MRFVLYLPQAFSLVEVLVAIVILSGVLLSLAASASLALRQVTDDDKTLRAAAATQDHAEQAFSHPCQNDAAVDSTHGITITTQTATDNATARLDVTTTHVTRFGRRTEQYVFVGGCY